MSSVVGDVEELVVSGVRELVGDNSDAAEAGSIVIASAREGETAKVAAAAAAPDGAGIRSRAPRFRLGH